MTQPTQNPAAHYAQAIEYEKSAWHALQAEAPGSHTRAQAWAKWSEAISRTNHAWRQLSCQTASRPALTVKPAADARPFSREASTAATPFKPRCGSDAQ